MEMLRTSQQGITVKSFSNRIVQCRNADTKLPVSVLHKERKFLTS